MAAGNSRSQASGTGPGPAAGGPDPAAAEAPLSFYALLQLGEDASLEDLRQAFRRQSKRLHPDTTSLPAALAQESFRQLRQAYDTLADPERRRAYDASLAAARARSGPGLRPSSAAQGASPAGAASGWAAAVRAAGIAPVPLGTRPSSAGSAGVANPASGAPGSGAAPGAASRQGNGGPGATGVETRGPGGNGFAAGGFGASGLGTNGFGASGLGAGGPGTAGLGAGGPGAGLPKPDSVRRTLSGGEWFALLLLGLALAFCLVLGVGLAWLRGTELVREPSWWSAQATQGLPEPALEAVSRVQPVPPLPGPAPSRPGPSLPASGGQPAGPPLPLRPQTLRPQPLRQEPVSPQPPTPQPQAGAPSLSPLP